ncbi:MAG: IS4 family transposase [Planctomycetota bacterium]|nr:IS4 family transposase [Planctomycetota bacterium]
MHLRNDLERVAEVPWPETFEQFRSRIDPAWIREALEATGTASVRHRRLPAEQVIWLVVGMALFRDRAITEVVETLDLALPGRRGLTVAPSAVAQARARLGDEPMQWLFETCGNHWAHASADRLRWRGLALYGADGTTLRIPDSDANRKHFTVADGGHRGAAAYPQVRLVALLALRSHLIARASFGPYSTGEGTYARDLWSALPDHSLCIVDRNFFAAHVLIPLARDAASRHWLIRTKKNQSWRVLQHLGPNDYRVEMAVSKEARRKDPSLPLNFEVRAIRYHRRGFQPQWLLTSMLDAEAYPASEIRDLYHERWELELSYDEIKTEMLDREETIRSKSPERIRQEIWGILLAYNLVRLEMEHIADEAKVDPTRISFITALHLICDEWLWCAAASPGAIPRHLRQLRASLQRFILPPRRPERRYPRAVKIKMSSYPRKRRPPTRRTAK